MVGCSNGGREAMIAAQRYPLDFDGVVAGDPAFDLTNAAVAEAWFTAKFAEISPKAPNGMPLLNQAMSESDLDLLAKAVLKACDSLDGLTDGMIDNPEACHFDPSVLQCKSEKNDSCLSPAQVHAIQTTFEGPKELGRQASLLRLAVRCGHRCGRLEELDSRHSTNAGDQCPHLSGVCESYRALPGEPPLSGPSAFNFDTDPARINKSANLINAASTKLAPFSDHGGKIILYTGMSDPVFSANDLIRYYQRMAEDNGGMEQARGFARLFRIPGMNHCFGGPALDNFDALAAIQEWVEKGSPPESMVATGHAFPGRSRPLCPYPETPHYKGSGNTDEAKTFVCRRP